MQKVVENKYHKLSLNIQVNRTYGKQGCSGTPTFDKSSEQARTEVVLRADRPQCAAACPCQQILLESVSEHSDLPYFWTAAQSFAHGGCGFPGKSRQRTMHEVCDTAARTRRNHSHLFNCKLRHVKLRSIFADFVQRA